MTNKTGYHFYVCDACGDSCSTRGLFKPNENIRCESKTHTPVWTDIGDLVQRNRKADAEFARTGARLLYKDLLKIQNSEMISAFGQLCAEQRSLERSLQGSPFEKAEANWHYICIYETKMDWLKRQIKSRISSARHWDRSNDHLLFWEETENTKPVPEIKIGTTKRKKVTNKHLKRHMKQLKEMVSNLNEYSE